MTNQEKYFGTPAKVIAYMLEPAKIQDKLLYEFCQHRPECRDEEVGEVMCRDRYYILCILEWLTAEARE